MADLTARERLAEALDAIRGRGYRNGATGALCARLSDDAAEDVPRLVAAVEAVLAIHRPGHHRNPLCAGCADVWPCQDYRAISAELLRTAASDA